MEKKEVWLPLDASLSSSSSRPVVAIDVVESSDSGESSDDADRTSPLNKARMIEAANAQLTPLLARLDAPDLERDEALALMASLERMCRLAGRSDCAAYARSKPRVRAWIAEAHALDAIGRGDTLDRATVDAARDIAPLLVAAVRAANVGAWRALIDQSPLPLAIGAYIDVLIDAGANDDVIALDCARRLTEARRLVDARQVFQWIARAIRANASMLALRLAETGAATSVVSLPPPPPPIHANMLAASAAAPAPPRQETSDDFESIGDSDSSESYSEAWTDDEMPLRPVARKASPPKRVIESSSSSSSSDDDDSTASEQRATKPARKRVRKAPVEEPPETFEYGGAMRSLAAKSKLFGITRAHIRLLVDTFVVDANEAQLAPAVKRVLEPLYAAAAVDPFKTTQTLTRAMFDAFGESVAVVKSGRRAYAVRRRK